MKKAMMLIGIFILSYCNLIFSEWSVNEATFRLDKSLDKYVVLINKPNFETSQFPYDLSGNINCESSSKNFPFTLHEEEGYIKCIQTDEPFNMQIGERYAFSGITKIEVNGQYISIPIPFIYTAKSPFQEGGFNVRYLIFLDKNKKLNYASLG